MDILDDMGVSKLSAKVFSKVNYSFKHSVKSPFEEKILNRTLKGSIRSFIFKKKKKTFRDSIMGFSFNIFFIMKQLVNTL